MYKSYTSFQYSRLRALASGFGHAWASVVPSTHPIEGCLWTPTLIRELYLAAARRDELEPWQVGISSPGGPSASGVVTHTTGTGRISWQVDLDGTVGIVISRPGEVYRTDEDGDPVRRSRVVLSALVRSDDRIEIDICSNGQIPAVWTELWSAADGPRAEARHGDALRGALAVMVGFSAAEAACDTAGVVRSDRVTVTTEDK